MQKSKYNAQKKMPMKAMMKQNVKKEQIPKEAHKQQRLILLNDTAQNRQKATVAVIVTFTSDESYDPLFSQEQQKSLQGTKVEVYACGPFYIDSLIEAIINNNPQDETAKRLLDSIKKVEPDCVVFNWQCAEHYSQHKFCEGKDKVFSFVKKVIDRGHMCMFSDFSLKALIQQWNQKYQLGPNPFVKTGQFSDVFELRFSSSVLKECPSAQLQILGSMAEQGQCNVHAAGGTIVFCVDQDKIKHQFYKTEVLTIVRNIKPPKVEYASKIGQIQGSAGHVILKYPSGGVILVSMGHWVELMKIDTSEKKIFQVAEREFGIIQSKKMEEEYMCLDVEKKKEYVSRKAKQFLQSQAPCSNMNKKKK